jgi:beta-galactosidase
VHVHNLFSANVTGAHVKTIQYGGDYNPEQWPEHVWTEDVRLMREAGVNLVSVGIFNWGFIEPSRGKHDFAQLDQIMELLADADIGVALGTPTAAPPSWWRKEHPEARLVDFDGRALAPGSRHGVCPSSPAYREACGDIAGRLAERYGDHPALRLWHVHNEFGWANTECYCPTSATAFQLWLADRYGDVDRLNEAWGTAFWGLTFSDFDEVAAPSASPPGLNPALRLDWQRFSTESHIELYRVQRDAIARHSPRPATTNFMIPNCASMDYWRWSREVDVVSNNHYLVAERLENHIELSMSADLTRAVAGGPWMLMEHSTSAVNWQDRNLAKRPGEMRRNSLAHVARGADAVMFFQWRASRAGSEKFHSAMLPHGGTDTQVWRDVVDLGSDLELLSDVVGTGIDAEAAILWDWESWWALELEWRPTVDLSYRERVEAYYEALWRDHVTVDFTHPESDLSKYKLVLAPSSYLLTANAGKNLHRYVEDGGNLVVSYFSGIVDEHDTVHPGAHPGALRDVLGLWVEEFHPLPAEGTLALDSGAHGRVWSERVRLDGAETVASFADGPDAGHPAVTRHRLGTGNAWYVATAADPATGLRELLAAIRERAGVHGADGVPDGVEAVRRGRFLFLLNHNDHPSTATGVHGADALTGAPVGGDVAIAAGGAVVVELTKE